MTSVTCHLNYQGNPSRNPYSYTAQVKGGETEENPGGK